jgi:hypothetical protein
MLIRLGRADYRRWSSNQQLEEWWIDRTKVIATLVPTGARVIEFGAGRRQLEGLLPAGSTYTPCDLVDRGPGTIVCDLNRRPLPDLSHLAPDTAIFGGVLEYIQDVPSLVQWLAQGAVQTCVASFDPFPPGLGIVGRYRELKRRTYYGYMNTLTEQDLQSAFTTAGYVCSGKYRWTTQTIFRFTRQI